MTVSRISSRELLMKSFFSGLVSVIPIKEGVILSVNQTYQNCGILSCWSVFVLLPN